MRALPAVPSASTFAISTAATWRPPYTRVTAAPSSRRLLYAAGSLLLPPILVARVARNVLRKRRHLREFAQALPAMCLLTGVWAWGECVGYLTGRPEVSLTPVAAREARA